MESEKLSKLNELFTEIVEALEVNDTRRAAELEFISQSIQDTLSPQEHHAHMLHYICMVTDMDRDDLVETIAGKCGSYDPEIQNGLISDLLKEVTDMVDEDNASHGTFFVALCGPKGLQ